MKRRLFRYQGESPQLVRQPWRWRVIKVPTHMLPERFLNELKLEAGWEIFDLNLVAGQVIVRKRRHNTDDAEEGNEPNDEQ